MTLDSINIKKGLIRKLFNTLCLCAFVPLYLFSQELQQTFDYANELYDKKDYAGAAETFRRVIYFDKNENYRKLCYRKIADCLYEIGSFEESADYYELAFFQQKDDSTKNEILFRKISCFLIQKNFDYAQIEFLNLPDSMIAEQKRRKVFYSAIINFATEKFDDSKKDFVSLIDSADTEKKQKLDELFAKNEKINKLSPRKAKIMSMILPGLGQFYAGDVKNGLNSMLLTAGIFTWGITAAIRSASPIDAVVSMIPWFQRYYTGGYNRAETIAENQKKKRRSRVYNQILDIIP